MASFTALYPPLSTRPKSLAVRNLTSPIHTLLSITGQNVLRAELSIFSWLLVGSAIHSLLIYVSPFWATYVHVITFGLLAYNVIMTIGAVKGVIDNPYMKNVRVGRHTAIFPRSDGIFAREHGESIGGEEICVVLLTVKCNHPLGVLYPHFNKMMMLVNEMYADLERNAEEHGFLGLSTYHGSDSVTQPSILNVIYFRSLEQLLKWAHGKSHRDGWDWWSSNLPDLNEISIAHEVYSVPAGKWENIYSNSAPFDFGATVHAITTEGGKKQKYMCPLVDANDGLKSATSRLASVQKAPVAQE